MAKHQGEGRDIALRLIHGKIQKSIQVMIGRKPERVILFQNENVTVYAVAEPRVKNRCKDEKNAAFAAAGTRPGMYQKAG